MKALRRRLIRQHVVITGLLLLLAEVSLWLLVRHAGQGELESSVRKEIEKIASLSELEPDHAEVYTRRVEDVRLDERPVVWLVTTPEGEIVGGSEEVVDGALKLPAVGGDHLAVEEFHAEALRHAQLGPVVVGRLLTMKSRLNKPGRPVLVPPTMVFDVRVALSSAATDAEARRILWFLLAGYPVLLALAALTSWRLVVRAVRPVEEAFERERRFTGAASHELRTPLTAMRGELELASRRERSVGEHEAIDRRLQLLVVRMEAVVEGLLILARAEAGHLLLGARSASVGTVITSIADVVRLLPGAEQVRLEIASDETRCVPGDPTLISQAVRVLVENALHHGGGSEVSLRVFDDGDAVVIAVQDAGPGFPPELLQARHVEDSSRLGLQTARAIIGAHRGTLALENRDGGGARATVRLSVLTDRRPGSGSSG